MLDPASCIRFHNQKYCVERIWKLEQIKDSAFFDSLEEAREYQAENGGVIKVKVSGIGYIDLEAITRWLASMSERCQKHDHNESNTI